MSARQGRGCFQVFTNRLLPGDNRGEYFLGNIDQLFAKCPASLCSILRVLQGIGSAKAPKFIAALPFPKPLKTKILRFSDILCAPLNGGLWNGHNLICYLQREKRKSEIQVPVVKLAPKSSEILRSGLRD